MASLRDLGEDRGVVAAVVAPWTAPPGGAIDLLAAERVPVVSLSWAWGPPREGDGLWLSFVARGRGRPSSCCRQRDVAPEGAPLCLAGDDTSRAGTARHGHIGSARPPATSESSPSGSPTSGRAASADAVAARIRDPAVRSSSGSVARRPPAPCCPRSADPTAIVGDLEDEDRRGTRARIVRDRDASRSARAWTSPCRRNRGRSASCTTSRPRAGRLRDRSPWRPMTPASMLIEPPRRRGRDEGSGSPADVDELTRFERTRGAYAFEPDGSRAPANPVRVPCGAPPARDGSRSAPVGASGDCVALSERSVPIVAAEGGVPLRRRSTIDRGGDMRLGFRRMTLLMGVLALVAAGCGEDTPPADGSATPAGEEAVCATNDTARATCSRRSARTRRSACRPTRVPAPVRAEPGDGRVRGLRHRRRDRDRRPPGRRGRVGDPGLGGPHRRQLERPLGHERRLDDADQRAAGGPELHRAVLLRAGRRGRARGLDRHATSRPTSTARRSGSARTAPTSSSWRRASRSPASSSTS